ARTKAAGDLLYHRPSFSGEYRLLHDLTQYAPGLNTSFADIQAVLDAEAKPTRTSLGQIDPEARKLIERARATGWQHVTYPAKDGAHAFTITVNGAGQFVYKRALMFGLRERVVCDGTKLLHLYEEIGLGARRSFSRFHRAEL